MAIYRNVQLSFWTDTKIIDDFTPEDRYFYLYLLTNPHTNLLGCYEISLKTMSDETGYTKDVIERLLDRFENIHNVVKYSKSTKEILIVNWHKHNWQGGNQVKAIEKQIEDIKSKTFRNVVMTMFEEKFNTPYKGLTSPMQATVTVTVTDNNILDKDKYKDIYINIISYLNEKLGTKYKPETKATQKMIKAKLDAGFSEEDFKTVIDNKVADWKGNKDMEKFLRPETLFCAKHFESYLNQKSKKSNDDLLEKWAKGEI